MLVWLVFSSQNLVSATRILVSLPEWFEPLNWVEPIQGVPVLFASPEQPSEIQLPHGF